MTQKTKNPIDPEAVRELSLHLTNEREFYDMTRVARISYARRVRIGLFKKELATRHLSAYIQEWFKTPQFKQVYDDDFRRLFMRLGKPNRDAAAAEVLEHYWEEIQQMANAENEVQK